MNDAFEAVLKNNRDKLNTKFAYARHAYPSLDGEALKDHLRLMVAPVAETVHGVAPDKTEETVIALYDISLDLVGKGLMGAETRYPALLKGWNQLFAQLPHLLTQDPLRFAGSVMNALFNLSIQQSTRPTFWIDEMSRIGLACADLGDFLDAGKVVAWRSGMAHFRDGALAACTRLEEKLAREALSIADTNDMPISEVVARLRQDPWLSPWAATAAGRREKELKVVSIVGAFRGFGGTFLSQPEVVSSDDEFYVFDNQSCWLMTADLFGATLHRIGATLPELKGPTRTEFRIDKAGNVMKGKQYAAFPHLAEQSSSAANMSTLAVTLPLSFGVYLIALV